MDLGISIVTGIITPGGRAAPRWCAACASTSAAQLRRGHGRKAQLPVAAGPRLHQADQSRSCSPGATLLRYGAFRALGPGPTRAGRRLCFASAPHLHELGEDADGNLLGRLRVDVQADRRVQRCRLPRAAAGRRARWRYGGAAPSCRGTPAVAGTARPARPRRWGSPVEQHGVDVARGCQRLRQRWARRTTRWRRRSVRRQALRARILHPDLESSACAASCRAQTAVAAADDEQAPAALWYYGGRSGAGCQSGGFAAPQGGAESVPAAIWSRRASAASAPALMPPPQTPAASAHGRSGRWPAPVAARSSTRCARRGDDLRPPWPPPTLNFQSAAIGHVGCQPGAAWRRARVHRGQHHGLVRQARRRAREQPLSSIKRRRARGRWRHDAPSGVGRRTQRHLARRGMRAARTPTLRRAGASRTASASINGGSPTALLPGSRRCWADASVGTGRRARQFAHGPESCRCWARR